MNQEKIGKFISKCRKEKKMTQSELASKLNVTDKTVSRWENGHYLPDVSLFNELCSILEIEVSELLNGEKNENDLNRKEVDETIMKIVNISKDEINQKKKKIILISSMIICIVIATFLTLLLSISKNGESIAPGDKVRFVSQIAVKEFDDGWVCHMNLEYLKNDLDYPYYYGYDCENFKYKKINKYISTGEEENAFGKYTYEIETNHPQYIFEKSANEDIKAINRYFRANKFNKKITWKQLENLNLNVISKDDVLELYNNAISSEKNYKWGNVVMLNHPSYLSVSNKKDNYTWYVGYIINFGHIEYISIDLMIGDTYLSDLIKDEKTSDEEKIIYNDIQEIKKYILEKRKIELPKKYKEKKLYYFLQDNFNEILNLEAFE